MNFSDLTNLTVETALEAGKLLVKGFGTHFQIGSKEGKHNLVTEYDTASQEFIIKKIKKRFPHHHFFAEEENVKQTADDTILWIIDPLDGTVNFAHNIPFFAVSIAAAQKKEILSGVVYNPMNQELFIAEKGKGAFLNGKKISVSPLHTLENAFLATGFPYNAYQNPLHCIDRFSKMVSKGFPLRRLGVASLDLAYVAAGRFDAFWEASLQPWDMAAGKLLIDEAGGRVSHYDGSDHPIFVEDVPLLASNGHLHPKLVELFKEDLK